MITPPLRAGRLLLISFVALLSASAFGQTFNISTGVNPVGYVEQNYTIISSPLGAITPFAVSQADGFPLPPWFANSGAIAGSGFSNGSDGGSAWLSATAAVTGSGELAPVGNYIFRVSFTLPADLSPLTSMTFQVATDNLLFDGSASAGIQGAQLNSTYLDVSTPNTFTSFSGPFSFNNSDGKFVPGLNTLDFFVQNLSGSSGNPVGLRVQGSVVAVVIPEPTTYALFIGVLSLGLAARRRFFAER